MDERLVNGARLPVIVADDDHAAPATQVDAAGFSGSEGRTEARGRRRQQCDNAASPRTRRRARSASVGSVANGDSNSKRSDRSTGTSASLGLLSSTSSSTVFPDAPDGGYGWVVVFASFMIHFIADGVSFSFGVMFPEIQNEFKATKGEAGFVASMFLALPLLAGPIASAVIDRYGCRPTVVAGGFISAAGILLSYFAPNIIMLYFTFGLIAGLGLSFTFSGSIVAVTYYFDKRRAIATGLTVCGTGLGTAVFAPLIELMLSEYGWKGSLLILSGIMLNQVIFGMMIRDLEWPEDTLEYKRERFLRRLDGERQSHNSRLQSRQPSLPTLVWDAAGQRRAVSLVEIPTYLRERASHSTGPAVASGASVLSVHLAQQAAQHAMHKVHPASRSRSVAANLLAQGQQAATAVPRVAFLTELTFAQLQENARRRRQRNRASCTSQQHYSCEDLGARKHSVDSAGDNAPLLVDTTHSLSVSASGGSPADLSPPLSPVPRRASVDLAEVAELVDAAVNALGNAAAAELRVDDAPVPTSERTTSNETQCTPINGDTGADTAVPPAPTDCTAVAVRRSRSKEASASAGEAQQQQQQRSSSSRVRRQSHMAVHDFIQVPTLTSGPFVRHRGRTANILDPDTYTRREVIHARFFSAPSMFRLRRRKRTRHTGLVGAIRRVCSDLAELTVDYAGLMRDYSFVLMLLSSLLLYLFYDIMYVNMPEYVEAEMGVSVKQASFVVSVIGFVNTGGMVLYGVVADWSGVNKVILYGVSISLCGLCTSLVYWLKNYYLLLFVAGLFGFTISANYTLASVIILDIMSLSDFVNAYGLMGAIEGVGTLIGPALCGYLFDWTGDYMATFVMGGVGIVLSGLLMLGMECKRCCRSNERHVTYASEPHQRVYDVDV